MRSRVTFGGQNGASRYWKPSQIGLTLVAWVLGSYAGECFLRLSVPGLVSAGRGLGMPRDEWSLASFVSMTVLVGFVATVVVEAAGPLDWLACNVAAFGALIVCGVRIVVPMEPLLGASLFAAPIVIPTTYLGVGLGRLAGNWRWQLKRKQSGSIATPSLADAEVVENSVDHVD